MLGLRRFWTWEGPPEEAGLGQDPQIAEILDLGRFWTFLPTSPPQKLSFAHASSNRRIARAALRPPYRISGSIVVSKALFPRPGRLPNSGTKPSHFGAHGLFTEFVRPQISFPLRSQRALGAARRPFSSYAIGPNGGDSLGNQSAPGRPGSRRRGNPHFCTCVIRGSLGPSVSPRCSFGGIGRHLHRQLRLGSGDRNKRAQSLVD